MNRRQRIIVSLAVFWSVALGVPAIWLWREDRHQRLNQQLIAAVKREDERAALAALKEGADVNTRDEHNTMPGWLRILNILQGRRPAPPTARTPLLILLQNRDFVADSATTYVRKENPGLVEALLSHGGQVDALDVHGRPPLFYALFETKAATARMLIEHGAKVSAELDGESLLMAAIRYNNDLSIVELMLQRGADPNRAKPGSVTPLELAEVLGDTGISQCLLRYHAVRRSRRSRQ